MDRFSFCRVDWFPAHASVVSLTADGHQRVALDPVLSRGETSVADAAARAIAHLGLEGWQLVTVVHVGDGFSYHFQRPIP